MHSVSPGFECLFCSLQLLNEALNDPVKSPFIVADVLERFTNFGGVRIEDDVLITKDGVINFATVPRT